MKSTQVRRSRHAGLIGGMLVLCMLATACGGVDMPDSSSHGGDNIIIGGIDRHEDIAVRTLWARILDERGYDVEVRRLDPSEAFAGLANDTIDVFLDGRLPGAHDELLKRHDARLVKLGSWHQDLSDPAAAPETRPKLWVLTRKKFARDAPKVAQWLRNFELGQTQLRRLETLVFEKFGGDHRKAVDMWISNNHELINRWIPA